jgi:hypothetical protein
LQQPPADLGLLDSDGGIHRQPGQGAAIEAPDFKVALNGPHAGRYLQRPSAAGAMGDQHKPPLLNPQAR